MTGVWIRRRLIDRDVPTVPDNVSEDAQDLIRQCFCRGEKWVFIVFCVKLNRLSTLLVFVRFFLCPLENRFKTGVLSSPPPAPPLRCDTN